MVYFFSSFIFTSCGFIVVYPSGANICVILILVLSIGVHYSAAGAIAFSIGSITISLSGLAVGALTGIVLNAILPGKDYTFEE